MLLYASIRSDGQIDDRAKFTQLCLFSDSGIDSRSFDARCLLFLRKLDLALPVIYQKRAKLIMVKDDKARHHTGIQQKAEAKAMQVTNIGKTLASIFVIFGGPKP